MIMGKPGFIKRSATLVVRRWTDSVAYRNLVSLRARISARVLRRQPFWYGQYPHTFLERRPPEDLGGPSELPRVIWSVWTGANEMSAVRKAGLEQLRAMAAPVPVVLVTAENLEQYLIEGHPLHAAYEDLSYTHRSDYLRAYLMYHYGGAYCDIKPMTTSWEQHFSRMENDSAWLLSTALPSPHETGNNRGRLGRHMRRYYRSLPTGGMLLARSHTPLTAEWLREVERTLTYAAPALAEHPRKQSDPGYPFEWMDLIGDILQPLALKYGDHVMIDPKPWWDVKADYR
ncbi:capsular polysaccharide synthesis protein [Microbacterium sp. Mu-80]|uniref:Capsular polysaccharide synthesis protein n=1 Tax=Microbacterium bandirmense TaxID=3122050 RepID=A0ABU8LA89_9MICO